MYTNQKKTGETINLKTRQTSEQGKYQGLKSVLNNDKGSSPKDITVNMHASKNKAPKYVKLELTELTQETNKSTVTVGDINTPLSRNGQIRQADNQ